VGYGDYGLTTAGERFTAVLLLVGIGTATYAFGQFVQAAVSYQLAWSHRMQKQIDRLSNHYIVCGYGRVGRTVCGRFEDSSIPFVVVDNNAELVDNARDRGLLAICDCAAKDEVLLRAGIKRAKGVICAVNSDAENIIITLSARELNDGVQIISRADEEGGIKKIIRAGATHAVSPSVRGGDDIANLITRPYLTQFIKDSRQNGSGYDMGGVNICEGSPLIGQTVREFGCQEPSIVFVAIQRKGEETRIRPRPDEMFQEDDVVIVVGESDAMERMANHTFDN
jgi:voltage-gated potassium channel